MDKVIFVKAEKPADFVTSFEVSGVFIEVGQDFLLMHRHPDKPYGQTWGLPAGKVEKGETAAEAAIREVEEETGISLPPHLLREIGSLHVRLKECDFIFHIFAATLSTRPPVENDPQAHIDWEWVTAERAFSYPLIVGGPEIFQFYLNKKQTSH